MKKISGFLLASFFYLTSFLPASAHVKWFVEEEKIAPIPWYTIWDKPVVFWFLVVFIMIFLGRYLDKIIKTPLWLLRFNQKNSQLIHRVAEILLGVFLIVTVDFFWNTIITPQIDKDSLIRIWISALQLVLGVLFISGLFKRWTAGFLMLLCIALGLWSGGIVFLENLLLLSLAFYLFIRTFDFSNSKGWKRWLGEHAFDLLRIGAGACLIVLAFTEKLIYPEFSLVFLEQHNWNFMQPLFPNFSNSLFVLSVGMSELLFGILITLGYLTRITTIALAVFLVSTATAMFLSIGDWEPGHVVIYAVAVLFVFFGSGFSTKKD